MTSNERKILECIRNHGGEVHVSLISSKEGFSSDYGYFLCRALKKAGYLEFSGRNFCRLSEKSHKYFSIFRPAESRTVENGQDHDNIDIITVSSLPRDESIDRPALFDKDDKLGEEEKIEEIEGDQKTELDPEAQQVGYGAGEKQDEDKNEEKTNSSPPADGGGTAVETGENAPRNNAEHSKEETEQPTANPTDNI